MGFKQSEMYCGKQMEFVRRFVRFSIAGHRWKEGAWRLPYDYMIIDGAFYLRDIGEREPYGAAPYNYFWATNSVSGPSESVGFDDIRV